MSVKIGRVFTASREAFGKLIFDARWANRSISSAVAGGMGLTADVFKPLSNTFPYIIIGAALLALLSFLLWRKSLYKEPPPRDPKARTPRRLWAERAIQSSIAVMMLTPIAIISHLWGGEEGVVKVFAPSNPSMNLVFERVPGGKNELPVVYLLSWPEDSGGTPTACSLPRQTQNHPALTLNLQGCQRLSVDLKADFKTADGQLNTESLMRLSSAITGNIPALTAQMGATGSVKVHLSRIVSDFAGVVTLSHLAGTVPKAADLASLDGATLSDTLGISCSASGCEVSSRLSGALGRELCASKPTQLLLGVGQEWQTTISLAGACEILATPQKTCLGAPVAAPFFSAQQPIAAQLQFMSRQPLSFAVDVEGSRKTGFMAYPGEEKMKGQLVPLDPAPGAPPAAGWFGNTPLFHHFQVALHVEMQAWPCGDIFEVLVDRDGQGYEAVKAGHTSVGAIMFALPMPKQSIKVILAAANGEEYGPYTYQVSPEAVFDHSVQQVGTPKPECRNILKPTDASLYQYICGGGWVPDEALAWANVAAIWVGTSADSLTRQPYSQRGVIDFMAWQNGFDGLPYRTLEIPPGHDVLTYQIEYVGGKTATPRRMKVTKPLSRP